MVAAWWAGRRRDRGGRHALTRYGVPPPSSGGVGGPPLPRPGAGGPTPPPTGLRPLWPGSGPRLLAARRSHCAHHEHLASRRALHSHLVSNDPQQKGGGGSGGGSGSAHHHSPPPHRGVRAFPRGGAGGGGSLSGGVVIGRGPASRLASGPDCDCLGGGDRARHFALAGRRVHGSRTILRQRFAPQLAVVAVDDLPTG